MVRPFGEHWPRVDGTAWLAGTLHVFGDEVAPGDVIPLLVAEQCFGSFDTLELDGDLAKLGGRLEVDGTTVWLVVGDVE